MRKIYLLHSQYNWDSYSLVRSMVEILKEREDVELVREWTGDCEVWLYDSRMNLTPNLKDRAIIFGLSDPNMFDPERVKNCDLYCTNDLNTARWNKAYHFPYGVDLKYFKKMDVKKDIDVLFVGTRSHPYIPYRKPYIDQLMKEVPLSTFGAGFGTELKGDELVEAYNRAHLNIDVCTKVSSLASRIFQAAACGTPTLTMKREDVLECFEDGKEIITYDGGYDSMRHMLEDALKNKSWIAEIGEAARQRVIKDHGMRKRVDDLIKYLGEVNGSKDQAQN